jgi:hypothetical protein
MRSFFFGRSSDHLREIIFLGCGSTQARFFELWSNGVNDAGRPGNDHVHFEGHQLGGEAGQKVGFPFA